MDESAINFLAILVIKESVLKFAKVDHISFTNNCAETRFTYEQSEVDGVVKKLLEVIS